MTKYIFAFANELCVLSERGFLNQWGSWTSNMDEAIRFTTTAQALRALDDIGENYNVIVCQDR